MDEFSVSDYKPFLADISRTKNLVIMEKCKNEAVEVIVIWSRLE